MRMSEIPRVPKVGDMVIYHDPKNVPHNALVTAGWGATCCNLLYISGNEAETDDYGRQVKRYSSSMHASMQGAAGNYWRWPDEEPKEYVVPSEV